jgi:hypothetical protein
MTFGSPSEWEIAMAKSIVENERWRRPDGSYVPEEERATKETFESMDSWIKESLIKIGVWK